MKVLKAKLIDYFEAKKRQEEENLKGEKKSIEWGNQIRSYVFHPYKMVKDHRTDFQTSDVESVVEGDISLFLESYLKHSHSK
jgi:peptide chain release factor 2